MKAERVWLVVWALSFLSAGLNGFLAGMAKATGAEPWRVAVLMVFCCLSYWYGSFCYWMYKKRRYAL